MIAIIVDTNAIVASPKLSRDEWVSLSDDKSNRNISMWVPEVVLMEAVHVVQRDWENQKELLKKAKVGTFGLQADLDTLVQGIQNHIDDYPTELHSRLAALSVQIVPTPNVPHLEVATRASKKAAPYRSGDKDGYRDTLIWLTVLELATTKPDHEIWFVSSNTQDFGDPLSTKKENAQNDPGSLPLPLNPQLQEELREKNLHTRVKYAKNLLSLEQHLAALYRPITDEDLESLKASVDAEALRILLAKSLDSNSFLATDPDFPSETLNEIRVNQQDWEFSEAARRGQGKWTSNFAVDVEAEFIGPSDDLLNTEASKTKIIRVSGTLGLNDDGQPLQLEVTSIEEQLTHPDRQLLDLVRALGFGQKEFLWLRDPSVKVKLNEMKELARHTTADQLDDMLKDLEAGISKPAPNKKGGKGRSRH